MFRVLFDGQHVEPIVELNDTEAFRVGRVVAEHGYRTILLSILDGSAQVAAQAITVEGVIAKHQGARLAAGELLTANERLGQAVEAGLLV